MRNIEIDFAEPFEKVLATVLSLPSGCSNAVENHLNSEAEIKEVIRGLYEGANGQRVKTKMGSIVIAPPACAFLKAKPFSVTTQTDMLIEAATRLIAGPHRRWAASPSRTHNETLSSQLNNSLRPCAASDYLISNQTTAFI